MRKAALLLPMLLSACAMYPEVEGERMRLLTVEALLAQPLRGEYFYYIAVDTDNGAAPEDGPVPILNGPPWGNGWGAISGTGNEEEPAYYVRWHFYGAHQFAQGTESGRPYECRLEEGGRKLVVTVDLNQVEDLLGMGRGSLRRVDLNIIATDVVVQNPEYEGEKWTDALGETGNSYVSIPLDRNWDYRNQDSPEPEGEGDVLDRNGRVVPEEEADAKPLDIVDWRIKVRVE